MLLKRCYWFFPYLLTNPGEAGLLVLICLQIKSLFDFPNLEGNLLATCKLFIVVAFVSIPRYLIKGKIPDAFNRGMRKGVKHNITFLLIFSIGLWFLEPKNRVEEDIVFFYQFQMWWFFVLSLLAHFFNKSHFQEQKL